MGVVKKPQSAYFHFSGERRKRIVEENPGLRVGDVQKLITARWKELTDEERQRYIDLAAKDKERYERERLENTVDLDAEVGREIREAEVESNVCLYPLGRVKRIVQSDPEVNKVSREALIAISKASELFAQFLATKSYEQTLFNNKRQIKASDVTRAIHITSVLDWLREDFPDSRQTGPAVSSKPSDGNNAVTKSAGKPSAADVSAFFAPRVSTNEGGEEADAKEDELDEQEMNSEETDAMQIEER